MSRDDPQVPQAAETKEVLMRNSALWRSFADSRPEDAGQPCRLTSMLGGSSSFVPARWPVVHAMMAEDLRSFPASCAYSEIAHERVRLFFEMDYASPSTPVHWRNGIAAHVLTLQRMVADFFGHAYSRCMALCSMPRLKLAGDDEAKWSSGCHAIFPDCIVTPYQLGDMVRRASVAVPAVDSAVSKETSCNLRPPLSLKVHTGSCYYCGASGGESGCLFCRGGSSTRFLLPGTRYTLRAEVLPGGIVMDGEDIVRDAGALLEAASIIPGPEQTHACDMRSVFLSQWPLPEVSRDEDRAEKTHAPVVAGAAVPRWVPFGRDDHRFRLCQEAIHKVRPDVQLVGGKASTSALVINSNCRACPFSGRVHQSNSILFMVNADKIFIMCWDEDCRKKRMALCETPASLSLAIRGSSTRSVASATAHVQSRLQAAISLSGPEKVALMMKRLRRNEDQR